MLVNPTQGRSAWAGALTVTSASHDGATRELSGGAPSISAVAEAQNAAQVVRYQLRRELGAGGMGIVYEAYDPELDRSVAVKVLSSSVGRGWLSREARALAKLSHPNVVAIYDIGSFGDHAFIAMELIEGSTLRVWNNESPRSLEEVLGVALQAGRGLAAAHAAGLLHRDFKPDNVMVGKDGRVRVLDFGIVSPLDAGDAAHFLAASSDEQDYDSRLLPDDFERSVGVGTLIGTPAYMAPEQFRAQTIDASADQFSFCVVLWELIYGERPFAAKIILDLVRGGDIGTPREPARVLGVPRWLRRILERGLVSESVRRYPSVVALLEALEAGLAREAAELRLLGRRYEVLPATLGVMFEGAERALDRFTGRVVTIQRVALPASDSTDEVMSRVKLARAFRELAALRHPNLISVLDFGFARDGAPYLVLDLRDAGSTLLTAGRGAGSRSVVNDLIQLTYALDHLHRRGIYLGAIEPNAALVVDDQVKLLPLGLTFSGGQATCVAPEVAAGAAPNVAGDLYALGLFALHHWAPFGVPVSELAAAPEQLRATLDLEPRISDVLSRLLSVAPAERYETARQAALALQEALGHSLGAESLGGREGRLRRAPLMGREKELSQLERSVRDACAGQGGAWLISGESGAGKSRMLEEVATLSIVHGALVLRGQEEREGGSPYRLFRDVLHGLTLLTDIDDLEASVLLPVLPNLSEQLKRPVVPAPELDARSTQARLVDVVQDILLRQEQPLVMLLEDLQWARSDSLDLLRRIVDGVGSLPLLIVAAGRDEQQALGAMRVLDLGRLSESVITEIAVSMIGESAKQPALLELLRRESEGNAFFLVEVVRALAEKAGGFERIGQTPLPDKVFAEGIQSLIQEQLRAVSGEARVLLRAAAVIGRQLEPTLLATLLPELDVEDCLSRCTDAAILERDGDALRFRHDQLREGVLATLTEVEKRELHARVSEAIEREEPALPERYAILAYHFGQAANAAKEAHYAAQAGEYALLNGAVREAIQLLERARVGLAAGGDPLGLGRVCVLLSDACYFTTEMGKAMTYASHAGAAAGFRFPSGKLQRFVALFWQLAVHVAYRVTPRKAREKDASASLRVGSIAAGCAACVSISLGDATAVLLYSLMAWNLAERASYPDLWASGILGYALASLGLSNLARSYFAATGRGARALEGSYPVLKTSFLLGMGELDAAQTLIREELELVRRTGFQPAETFSWFLLGYCAYYRGELDEAERCFALAVEHEGTRANFAPGLALMRCLGGRHAEAKALLDESLDPINPAVPRSIAFGVLALIHLRSDELPAALGAADNAVALAGRATTFGYAGAAFFSGVFEVFLAELALAKREGRPTAPVLGRLRRLTRHCRTWSRAFRVGQPLRLLYESKLARLMELSLRAQMLCSESRARAESMGLGYYVTLAVRELGGAPSAPATLRRARAKRPT